jgi:hypothetical protein
METAKQEVKARKPRNAEAMEHIGAVVGKYEAKGWKTLLTMSGATDIIAQSENRSRLHFIQVVRHGHEGGAKYGGESKNTFVQNAFSNGATPVHAFVEIARSKMDDASKKPEAKITLRDVNLDKKVLV